MSKYCKLVFSYRWTFSGLFKNIDRFFSELKWYYQRAVRGYADCDVWGFDYYLAKIIYGGLVKLRSFKNSYPVDLTPEEWEKILDFMIEGFKAANEILDDEVLFNECKTGKNTNIEITNSETGEITLIETPEIDYSKYRQMIEEKRKKFEEGMDIFKKYYFDLWD